MVLRFDSQSWCDFVVAYAGVLKAGGVVVALSPQATPVELVRVVSHCAASIVISSTDLPPPDLPPEARARTIPAEELEAGQDQGPVCGQPPGTDPVDISYRPEALRRLQTRGHTQDGILTGLAILDAAVGHGAGGPSLHTFPPGSDGARAALWSAVTPGRRTVVVLPRFQPEALCRLSADQGMGRWSLAPSAAAWVLDSGALERHDLSSLVGLVLVGGRARPELAWRLGEHFPQARVVTSMSIGSSDGPPVAFLHDRGRPGSLGRPLGGVEVCVVDEAEEELSTGAVGRLRLVHPAGAGDEGWNLVTEELGYLEDGAVYPVASTNGVLRRPGATVLAEEVAQTLRRQPGVTDAAVFGIPDDERAEQIGAAVVTRLPMAAKELQNAVRRRLGATKSPDVLVFVETIPRNERGVLLHRRLRERMGLPVERVGHVKASTPVEETIVAMWERVLARDGVGVHDDYFELGGDQMGACRILDLMADAFGVAPSLSTFLASPTVAALAASAERDTEAEGDPQVAPVAFSQEGMVWHEQLAPGSQSLPPLVRRYRGLLDVGVLGRALAEIVRRHEPLRTTFELRQGRLVQVVAPPGAFRLSVKDVSGLPASGQDAELAKVLSGAARPFHLVDGPLFEATLIRLGAEDHVVVFKVHHSVYDDWSVSLFRRELSCLYRAFLAGEPSPLADLPVGFAEVSRAQRRRLAGRRGTDELSWWRRELRGAPLCLELPIDDPERPAGATQASAEPVSIELPNELSVQLRALARRERTTLFMTMLAAFQVLVERYTGQPELVLATVVANRNRSDLERMIGCFTKKVLVRLRASGGDSFAQLLPRVRASVLGALSHQDLPFETVLQQTLGREVARHGLVPQVGVMFQGVTPQGEELVLPGLTTSGYDTSATTTRTHFASGGDEADAASATWGGGLYLGTFLILSLIESGEAISLSARGAFHRPSVEGLLANFQILLAEVAAHPSRPLHLLALGDGDQRAEPGRRENDAVDIVAQASGTGCAHQLFEVQVEQAPSRPAIIEGGRTLTYAEVDAEATKLASRLQAGGVQPGALVGICLDPSVDAVVAVLGVWKSGAGFVALDPRDSDEHLLSVVEVASLGLVVTNAGRASRVRSRLSARGVEIEVMTVSGSGAYAGSNRSPTTVPVAGDPAAPALVFFGSSPSGPGPGVVIQHRAVVNLAAGLARDLYRAGPERSAPSPVCVGLSASLAAPAFLRQMAALLSGHTLRVFARGDDQAENGVLSHLRAGTLDLIDCSPHDLEELAEGGLAEALRERPGGAGTPVVVAGSTTRIDPEVWANLAALPEARTCWLYGPPECTFGSMLTPVAVGGGRVTVGLPLAGVVGAVLDIQGRPLPRGATGELYLGGESMAGGYLGGSRAVEGRLGSLQASEEPASRLFGTGQLARRLPDGRFELLGGVGDVVALCGFRVDTACMESALQRCAAVGQVAVVLREDLPGEPNLVAYVVPSGEVAPTLNELRCVLWTEMPGYAWPAALVVVDHLPRLANVNVDLASLPASDPGIRLEHNDVLASLWAEVLGVQQVQADENYWQSFSFLDVIARAREAGFLLPDRQVSRNRVLATLHTDMAVAASDLPDS